MKYHSIRLITLTTLFASLILNNLVQAQFTIDVEAGIIATGYNDVRIPGVGGTFISLSDDLTLQRDFFSRIRIAYRFNERSELLALYAPLELSYRGFVNIPVIFLNQTFSPGEQLNATYKFNSYRATYRYYLLSKINLELAAGLTMKIRDALIGIAGEMGREAVKTDLGVVPLINFWLHWQPTPRVGIVVDADALTAPQGRAEDILFALTYKATENFTIKAGYRLLEGGADNSTVYTFSMFHYAALGVMIRLE